MRRVAHNGTFLAALRQSTASAGRSKRGIVHSRCLRDSEDLYTTADVKNMSEKELELYKLYRPERITPNKRGVDLLKTPALNKGMAFSLYERQYLGLHGLLPPAFMTEEQQVYRIISKLREQPNDLARYIQLDSLQDRNEKLYYRVLCEHIKELMPIVYTPTVGLACQNFGYIYRNPKGLYITINDNSISKIVQILCNWPETDIRAIVVTDGEHVLGLGDLGAYGMGIPVGKLALYVALGGIQPRWCLPVLLDVGTDNPDVQNDPYYIGLRHKRVRGEEYDRFLDLFMAACAKRYGNKVLIQFEDFASRNAYRLLDRYRHNYVMFNDDVQGTAAVVVAGLLACTRITKKKISEQKFMIFGTGQQGTGIANMLSRQMQNEGLTPEDTASRIFLLDKDGLVTKSRGLKDQRRAVFAKDMPETNDVLQLIRDVRPAGIIGASSSRGAFNEEILRLMAEINPRPIIFSLSSPVSRTECTAEEAYRFTEGTALYGSSNPFPTMSMNGKILKPGQGNNAYIFPGITLGTILFEIRNIDKNMFLIAAKVVASYVTEDDLVFPRLQDIREISIKIAIEIANYAYEIGTARLYPRPEDMEKYIRSQIYSTHYDELINATYDWPAEDMKHGFPVPVTRRESTY